MRTTHTFFGRMAVSLAACVAIGAAAQAPAVNGRGDIAAEAESLGCSAELKALKSAELMKLERVESALFLRVMMDRGGDYSGTPAQAFSKLVGTPHQYLMGDKNREGVDAAWYAFVRSFNLSRESSPGGYDQPAAAAWRDFENKALTFHQCTIKSRFGFDFAQEARDRERGAIETKAFAEKMRIEARAEVAKLQPGSLHYACGLNGEFPGSFEAAQLHYWFRNDGRGQIRSFGFDNKPASTVCRSAEFTWTSAGKTFKDPGRPPQAGDQLLMKFESEENDFTRCYGAKGTRSGQAVLIATVTGTPGRLEIREHQVAKEKSDGSLLLWTRNDGGPDAGAQCLVRRD